MTLATLTLTTGPTVAYEDSGGSGVPVIFSHGLFMDHSMFDAQVAEFASGYRCITWDERAHGKTQWNGPFTYWESGRDLLAMMDALGIERAIHVGMSQGGILGIRAALTAPHRFIGLVQLATQCGRLEGADGFKAIIADWVENGATPDKLEFLTGLILGPSVDTTYWHKYWKSLKSAQIVDAVSALYSIDEMYGRLPELSMPVCTIHGLADVSTPHALALRVASEVPNARGVTLIEGGPHAVNMTHADQVNAALRAFFDSLK
jgi:3-oxoadipate enol-lactonase